MKQKYIVSISEDGKQLTIKEFSEIDKDMFYQLCEVHFDLKEVKSSIKDGPDHFAGLIRSRNFFPPLTTVQQIFAEMDSLNSLDPGQGIEVLTDDVDILAMEDAAADMIDGLDDDAEELDELLEDDVDVYDDKLSVKTSIKVDDDDAIEDNGDI